MAEWRLGSVDLKKVICFFREKCCRPVYRWGHAFLLLFLVLWAGTVVTLVATHICLIFGKGPLGPCRWWPDLILGFVFGSSAAQLTESQYASLVADMIAAFAFVMAAWAFVKARLYKSKVQRELAAAKQDYDERLKTAQKEFDKKLGIISCPIEVEEDDDLKWMVPHYEAGDRITVFAGEFAWLATNQAMKRRVCQLAREDKLKLVSYKTKAQVEQGFQRKNKTELFNELKRCFRYESGLGSTNKVVCTMIQQATSELKFLYKSGTGQSQHAFNAQVLNDTDSMRALLRILFELTKAEHWGRPDNNAN
jgi:hypothetical protein